MLDLQNLPVSGGLFLAILFYCAASFFVTGPLVGERTIENSGWSESCPAALNEAIASESEPAPVTPRLDCQSTLGWLGRDFQRVCDQHGNPEFKLPFQDQVQAQERALHEAQQRRLERRAAQSGSRCACAAALALENRTAWALYAGSARLVTPPDVAHLDAALTRALHSPHCALKDGDAS